MNSGQKGWVSAPKPVTEEVTNSTPLSHRRAIEEQNGGAAKKKIRLIDDPRRPQVNSLLKLNDASVPNALDTILAMVSAFALSWPPVALILTIMDFAHAYQHIGVGPNSNRFAATQLPGPQERLGSPI